MFSPDPGNLVRCTSKETKAPYHVKHGHHRHALVLAGTATPPSFATEWRDFLGLGGRPRISRSQLGCISFADQIRGFDGVAEFDVAIRNLQNVTHGTLPSEIGGID